MKKKFLTPFHLYLLLTFSTILMAAKNPETPNLENKLDDTNLISELRQGGYILYFRHGKTNHDTFDSDREDLKNCTTQRLLSQEGREEMTSIGISIKRLGIRVGTVVSSPYCRSIDTVTLAFGRAKVSPELKHTVTAGEAMMKHQAEALREMLSTVPEIQGTNDVLSAHSANLLEAVGIWPKPEGVAVVFKPQGNSFKHIATILPTDWQRLLKGTGQR